MRAHLAICSHGFLGLITSDAPQATPYSANYQDLAWTGIHLTERDGKKVGDRWQSKEPKIICHIGDPPAGNIIYRFNDEPKKWAKFPDSHAQINYVSTANEWVEMVGGRRWQWDGVKWVQA